MFFQMFNVMYLSVAATGMLHIKITFSIITTLDDKRPFRSVSTKIGKIDHLGSRGIRVIFARSHKIGSFEIGKLTLVQILQEVDCVARILCNLRL